MNGFADRGLDEGDFGSSTGISVKSFDAFPKVKTTYLTRTQHGQISTLITTLISLYLLATELHRWTVGTTTHTFSVEKGIARTMQLNLDFVIPMRCEDLHVNVQDASGDRILAGQALKHDDTIWRAYGNGEGAGDALGAGQKWEKEQHKQYAKEEDVHDYLGAARGRKKKFARTIKVPRGAEPDACRVYGSMEGNKVQGDFHITARGHGYMDFSQHLDHKKFNFTHHINELSFGPYYPSLQNPLDLTQASTEHHFHKFQYHVSIVPTIYTDRPSARDALLSSAMISHNAKQNTQTAQKKKQKLRSQKKKKSSSGSGVADGILSPPSPSDPTFRGPLSFGPHTIHTNQYAVNENSRPVPEHTVPGIFVKYDIEPILLVVSEEWEGLLALVVKCVNVVAGVLVAGGWVVRLVDWAGEVRGRRRGGGGVVGGEGLLDKGAEGERREKGF
ncbi:MAG: hypothetical protein M1831_006962 [Alyxoria varia]|nr:MAG: hypothetical protein M1831_006962 [Alyxoria varia]